MHKVEQIPALLASMQAEESATASFNESAITADYQKHYDNRSGIAVKVLIVFGGFLASLAFVGFMALLQIFENEVVMLVLGVMFALGGLLVNRLHDKLIVDTFSVSMYLIGLILSDVALGMLKFGANGCTLYILLMSAITLAFNRSYVFVFLGVLLCNGSLLALIGFNEVHEVVHLYIIAVSASLTWWMLNEAKIITIRNAFAGVFSPVRSALVFSLLVALFAVGKRGLIPVSANLIWLSSAGTIGIIMYLVAQVLVLLNKQHIKNKWLLYAVCLLCLASTAFAPAIAGAVLILLLSFMVNYRVGIGIAVVALTYFVSQYYYDLNFTLLQKSGILVSSGVLLLVLYFFTAKMMGDEKI